MVCDGCGSGRHSEFGAQLGASLVTECLRRQIEGREALHEPALLLETVRRTVLARLSEAARLLGDDFRQSVSEYLLFTIAGALVTPVWTALFAIGDGVFFLNGEMIRIGPFPGNAPPYLAYTLLGSSVEHAEPALLRFQLQRCCPTSDLHSLLIGSDGACDLAAATGCRVPGKTEAVGPISQFWEEDRYFRNPDALRRKLALLNREVVRHDARGNHVIREAGLLRDDTTLIIVRRGLRN